MWLLLEKRFGFINIVTFSHPGPSQLINSCKMIFKWFYLKLKTIHNKMVD